MCQKTESQTDIFQIKVCDPIDACKVGQFKGSQRQPCLLHHLFQTLLGVRGGQLLDNVVKQSTAIKLVLCAWSYSVFAGLMIALHGIDPNWVNIQQNNCQFLSGYFSRASRTLFCVSLIIISILVAMIQVTSFVKLRRRLNVRVAPVGVGRVGNRCDSGINMLYKRAMRNSALVGISFMVGWLPVCIMMLLYDWGHIDQDTLINVGWLVVPLTMMQGLANAVIFRARNIYMFFQRIFSRVVVV